MKTSRALFLLAPVTASAWSTVSRSTRRSVRGCRTGSKIYCPIPDEHEEDISSITMPRSTNAAAEPLKQHHAMSQSTITWLQQMAQSYQLERGENLLDVLLRESISLTGSMDDDLATLCANTNLAIASHDFIRDPTGEPIYCYGNDAFLSSFEYNWEEFVQLPSRYCVDSDAEVKERNKLLNESRRLERTTDEIPELIRVTKNKRRILLQGVNLWNVYDFHNDVRLKGYDGSTLRAKSIRDQIDRGDIKAIGQAVWIRQVVESI